MNFKRVLNIRPDKPYYGSIPVYFTPIPMEFIPEIFIQVSEDRIPGVCDYYYISNYGRLWHKYQNRFLTSNLDSKGYCFKPLYFKDGTTKLFRIHRLVGLHFMYYPGCEDMLINHKDGIKTNNFVGNLEWATYSDNAIHAYKTGLNKLEKYDNKTIIKICEMLQEGDKTYQQISDELNVDYHLVQGINSRKVHVDISEGYNFGPRKIDVNFTLDQVKSICKYISENKYNVNSGTLKAYYAKILLNALGISNPTRLQIRSVEKIYTKQTYRFISKDYDM